MHQYIIESLLLGLSVGPVCLAYCAPVVFPLLFASHNPRLSAGSFTLFMFLTGRFFGYLIVGMVVGIVGSNIQQLTKGGAFGIISIVLGLTLIYFGVQKGFPELRICRFIKHRKSRTMFLILLGFLTGLNLCPPFLAAIVGASDTGSITGSLVYFSVFFIGTVVFFPVMVFLGLLSRIDSVRNIANICLTISGTWLVLKGLLLILSHEV
jgi:sulfite exporter TauE/SafE